MFEEARRAGAVPHALSMLSVEGGAASIAVDAVAVRQATRPVAAVPGVRVRVRVRVRARARGRVSDLVATWLGLGLGLGKGQC